jgi:hypothetical protein
MRPIDGHAQAAQQRPDSAAVIVGVVRDSAGTGVPNVNVMVSGAALRGPLGLRTNAQGQFHASVPAGGEYVVRVKNLGYAAQETNVTVRAGTSRIVEIELGGESVSRLAAAPNLPLLQPFANAENWVLHTDLVYRVGTTKDSVIVPAGFVTDFASIPKRLQSVFSVHGPYLLAGIVHDYLYWEQGASGCTRAEADGIFRLVMIENKVTRPTYNAMYRAVRLAGQGSWDGNATDRRAALVRTLPVDRRTIQPLTLWSLYRRTLYDAGLRPELARPISRAFCAQGTRDPRAVLGRF